MLLPMPPTPGAAAQAWQYLPGDGAGQAGAEAWPAAPRARAPRGRAPAAMLFVIPAARWTRFDWKLVGRQEMINAPYNTLSS